MERSAWAWMPAAALLLCWVSPRSLPRPDPPVGALDDPAGAPAAAATVGVPSAPSPDPSIPAPGHHPVTTGRPGPAAGLAGPSPGSPPVRPAAPSGANTSALATGLTLKPAPLEPTDLRFPINLATALRLADARPLIVAAAQAGVWVAEADLTRAKLLFIPTLNVGFDYVRHDGGGPDFNKGIMTAPSVNFFYGGGGLTGTLPTTDAIFQPLVARQVLNSAHWDIQAAKNDAVMQTADAYFQVHQYRGMFAGALYSVERGRDLVERVADLSREFVPKVEVDRARNMLADLEQQAVSARQEWRVASANLTQVLRLDPRAVVVPLEHDHTQITLIDPGRSLDDLMPVALTNRPELGLAPGAGPGDDAIGPPREVAPPPAQRAAQRLPDPLRVAPGRDLRPRPQQQPQPVAGPRRLQHPAPLAAPEPRDRQPRDDQGPAGDGVEGDHRVLQDPGHGGGRRDPRPGPRPVGGGPRRPGRPRNAHGHHHLQRELRGPATDHPPGQRPGAGQPARRRRSSPSSS